MVPLTPTELMNLIYQNMLALGTTSVLGMLLKILTKTSIPTPTDWKTFGSLSVSLGLGNGVIRILDIVEEVEDKF